MTKARGPVPKRTDERRRRNKAPGQSKVQTTGAVRPPATPRGLHPVARRSYASLKDSGQSQFYEPSDWQHARLVTLFLSDALKAPTPDAEMWTVVFGLMDETLDTDAARWRAGIEIERVPATRAELIPIENYRPTGAEE